MREQRALGRGNSKVLQVLPCLGADGRQGGRWIREVDVAKLFRPFSNSKESWARKDKGPPGGRNDTFRKILACNHLEVRPSGSRAWSSKKLQGKKQNVSVGRLFSRSVARYYYRGTNSGK